MRLVFRTGLFFLILGSLVLGTARAQTFPVVYNTIYRPLDVRYLVLKSPHFDLIFEEGAEAEAREAAAILEAELPRTQALVGSRRRLSMPVVLNRYNDQSNGFVSSYPFKQEIETVSIKGNRLSGRFSSWMWAVAPHELTHAVQANGGSGFGMGGVLRWVAPDLMRDFNLVMPAGIIEGAAVYHESRVQPGAGRLNFSLFQMQFRAAMLSDDPWSLAQLLEVPAYTRPADRFYIGGSNFFNYLAAQDSARFFRRILGLHYRFPFLGHGVELWYGTGTRPAKLKRWFRRVARQHETARIEALGPLSEPRILAEGPGRFHRRPRWVDDSTLVAYVSGYDLRSGFYRIDARTGRRTRLSVQGMTEDIYFSLSQDTTAILFSRYDRDTFAPTKWLAETFRLDLATGKSTRLTRGGRTFAPVETRQGVWALQNDGQFNQWVRIQGAGQIVPLTAYQRVNFIHLAPSPADETVAVVVGMEGRQGLYRASFEADGSPTLEPWLLFDEATIHDASWSPDGRYLLFSADPGGITNVYAYDLHTDRVLKLTNVAFGALEPSLSPDGRTLAFVDYQHEQFNLALMPFAPEEAEEVPRSLAAFSQRQPEATASGSAPEVFYEEGEVRPYRAVSYLAPRMLYPTAHYDDVQTGPGDTDLGVGVGLAMQGSDPLEQWVYGGDAFYQDERVWGRLTASTTRSIARPFLTLFDLPSTVMARRINEQGEVVDTLRVGREERGAIFGVSLPVTLHRNIFSTTASLRLQGEFEQERLFGPSSETLAPFQGRFRLSPSGFLAHRLQTNRRDLMPNTGTILSSTASIDAWRESGGALRRGAITQLTQYLSLSQRSHTGVRLQAGLLTQNQGSIYNLDNFLPRGHENTFLGRGTFLQLNLLAIQPLWYIDDGFMLLPFYFKALYAYGFAETLVPVDDRERPWSRISSVGGGLGFQFRFFYRYDFDLRLGASYLVETNRWEAVYR